LQVARHQEPLSAAKDDLLADEPVAFDLFNDAGFERDGGVVVVDASDGPAGLFVKALDRRARRRWAARPEASKSEAKTARPDIRT